MGSLIDAHLRFMPTSKSQFLQVDLTNLILQNFSNTLFLCLVGKGCLEDRKKTNIGEGSKPHLNIS